MSVDLKAYKGTKVAKVFPLYGDKPFEGIVDKVDARDKRTPIHITYEDGDAEWISHEELQQIIQKAPEHAAATKVPRSEGRRARGKNETQAALANEADHCIKKHKSSSNAGAASADVNTAVTAGTGFDADKAKRSLKDQAGALQGITQFTFTARAAQHAAAARVSPVNTPTAGSDSTEHVQAAPVTDGDAAGNKAAAVADGKGSANKAAAAAALPPAAPASPAPDLPQLLTAIHQTANTVGGQGRVQQPPARLLYRGPGATMLPVMSQAVTAAGECHISLYSTGKSGSSTPGRGLQSTQQGYQSEAEAVLNELDKLLVHGASSRSMLIKVKVTLRNMADVLPGFKAAWDAWVDRGAVPVLTLCEGAGPFTTSNITVEAMACTKSH